DIPNTEARPSSRIQPNKEEKRSQFLTIDDLIKWISKLKNKNNKKLRSKPIPKTNEEWYDLIEIDNEKDSKPSDDVEHLSSASSEYDTAEEDPDVYFEKINDPYINRITETEKFNESEVCDYYAFVPKEYYAEGEPLAFFESIEEKIENIYKKELTLKGGLKVRIVLYAYMKKIEPETQEPKYKTFPFKHETIEIIREDRINATIEKGYNEIIDQIEDEAIQESGWSFVRAEEVFLEISAFRPLRGSSYLSLPEALDKPQLGLINPQNRDDNECFKWCISAYHIREEAIKNNRKPPHLNEIRRLRRNANIANYEGIKFPATLHDIDKFEEINPNYAINIFRPVYSEAFGKIKVDIDPLHISERNYQVEHMIDLLYLTESEENLNDRKNPNDIPEGLKTHYILITDFTRLMHKWNNHHDKKYFCRKCLRFPYSRLDLLEKHIPTCTGASKAPQRLILPEEGKNYVKPKYIKNMLMKPYLISMDLEAEEVKVEEKDKEGNTIKIAEQKAVSYGYTIHCSDGTTQKPVINRESENIIKDLMENLQEDLDVILDKLRIPIPCEKMMPELWRKYQMASKCWGCEENLHEAGYNKIRVFDPETKKYLGASHRKCHGKRSMIKAKVTDEKIVPIANNSEQYITFLVGQLQFIDSLKFSLPGLAKMAENLRDEKKGQTKTPEQLAKCFPIMSKFISPNLLSLLTRKGIFPYQWLNSKTKFNETQLPSRKDFNSDLDGYNYCEHGCENKELKNLPEDQWILNDEGERVLKNTKVIGKWKDENGGDRAIGYAGVRAKCYSVVCENSRKNMIKAKGLKKSLIKKELSHKIFEDCVLEGKGDQPRTAQFLRSYRHRMYRIKQTKRSVNPFDSKLWIAQNNETTYLFGDCEIPEE
ncbi:14651_t:CDS:2, partial [Dentiscutata erythropus]